MRMQKSRSSSSIGKVTAIGRNPFFEPNPTRHARSFLLNTLRLPRRNFDAMRRTHDHPSCSVGNCDAHRILLQTPHTHILLLLPTGEPTGSPTLAPQHDGKPSIMKANQKRSIEPTRLHALSFSLCREV